MTILGVAPWLWLLFFSCLVGIVNLRMCTVFVIHLLAFQLAKADFPDQILIFTLIYLVTAVISFESEEYIGTFFMALCCLWYVLCILIEASLSVRSGVAETLMLIAIVLGFIDAKLAGRRIDTYIRSTCEPVFSLFVRA